MMELKVVVRHRLQAGIWRGVTAEVCVGTADG